MRSGIADDGVRVLEKAGGARTKGGAPEETELDLSDFLTSSVSRRLEFSSWQDRATERGGEAARRPPRAAETRQSGIEIGCDRERFQKFRRLQERGPALCGAAGGDRARGAPEITPHRRARGSRGVWSRPCGTLRAPGASPTRSLKPSTRPSRTRSRPAASIYS